MTLKPHAQYKNTLKGNAGDFSPLDPEEENREAIKQPILASGAVVVPQGVSIDSDPNPFDPDNQGPGIPGDEIPE